VITDDRALVIGHVHRYIWRECMKRNATVFARNDRPTIWTPKVILQGLDFWTQYLLKLYDRGDLPRKYMVEFGGYDYDAVKAQKQREVEGGHDQIFAPPPVPYSSPGQGPGDPYQYGNPSNTPSTPTGPNDNGGGRPPGARNRNGGPPDRTRPTRVIRRTPGETVRAAYNEAERQVIRIGEITERVLGEYPEATLGRITPAEREALEACVVTNIGNVIVVPVNLAYAVNDEQVVRLDKDFSMIVGHRVPDGAIVARAFAFREPSFATYEAEDMVIRWGYPVRVRELHAATGLVCPSCGAANDIDAEECAECGYIGPPFTIALDKRKGVAVPPQPIAFHVHLDGETLAKGGIEPGKYTYLKCPECGLIQDAANSKCTRCGHDLTEARKGMFASLKGKKPTLHDKPPPPASEQPDLRKGK
jgi:ribosomal protein L37E